jgi:hypothetical protein
MFKRASFALLAFSALVIVSVASFAQNPPAVTITQADVEWYVKAADSGATGLSEAIAKSSDPERYAAVSGKLTTVAGIFSAITDKSQRNASIESIPTIQYTPEELTLLETNEAEIVAALKKISGQ